MAKRKELHQGLFQPSPAPAYEGLVGPPYDRVEVEASRRNAAHSTGALSPPGTTRSSPLCRFATFEGTLHMDLATATSQPSFINLAKTIAERTSPIITWIGAGLSAPAGIPSWPELRRRVHQATINKANTLEDEARRLATLNSISKITDPWIAFERLHSELGSTSFTAEIRKNLDITGKTVPDTYRLLLKLPLRGIMSLNIDSFCLHAVQRFSTTHWKTFTGRDAPRMTYLLQLRQPFAVQLHGTFDDQSSWVFRRSELNQLLANDGYTHFVNTILSTHTLIFVGVTADDVSAGGFLDRLSKKGINTGTHYWITHRADSASDRWAEQVGIQIVRYDQANEHRMLGDLLLELGKYVSIEEPLSPVAPSTALVTLPEPELLINKQTDEIRAVLNEALLAIPTNDTEELSRLYRRYRKCIMLSWDVDVEPPENTFFGRVLEDKLGEGAFGTVYLGKNQAGEYEAVKILHQDVYTNPDMLNSFQRGARSMTFLTSEEVPGVVRSIASYNMPPSIIMEYVPGMTLLEAMDKRLISDWNTKLEIAMQLARIVRRAHQSVHRILHRDLRPHNVMLKMFFERGDPIELIVLDFDLSWHRDSLERSIYPRVEGALGYAAPEQFGSGIAARTRTSLVDCFGLGMTMLYLATGRHPRAREQDHAKWQDVLEQEIAFQSCSEWHSLPYRFSRLIHGLTYTEQDQRIDYSLAVVELTRMRDTILNTACSPSVLAEEVMHRVVQGVDYSWDSDEDLAIAYMSGGRFTCQGLEVSGGNTVSFVWADTGDRERRTLSVQLRSISDFAMSRLIELGWTSSSTSVQSTNLELTFTIETESLWKHLPASIAALQQIKAKFAFR